MLSYLRREAKQGDDGASRVSNKRTKLPSLCFLIIAVVSPATGSRPRFPSQDANAAIDYRARGKEHYSAGRYQEAAEAFKQAVRLKPDDPEAHHGLGLAFQSLRQYDEAVASYNEAIRLKPDWAEPYSDLGVAYRSMKRFKEAVDSFREAIQIKPDWAVPFNHLGILYLNTGQDKEAVNSFKEAIRLKPDWAEAQNNLGVAYSKSNLAFDAIDVLKEAIRLKPDWAEPYNNLGVAQIKIGKHEEAVKTFKEAIRLKPDWAQAHLNLGVAYIKFGDRQKALEQHAILMGMNLPLADDLKRFIDEPRLPINGGVLNGKALMLPRPSYPAVARAQHASGTVTVQVTIDEEGNVIEAKAVSGHPLLQPPALLAARQARFSPTKLEGRPVKVTGVITYNFVDR
jgi:TonB family protein